MTQRGGYTANYPTVLFYIYFLENNEITCYEAQKYTEIDYKSVLNYVARLEKQKYWITIERRVVNGRICKFVSLTDMGREVLESDLRKAYFKGVFKSRDNFDIDFNSLEMRVKSLLKIP